MKYLIANGPGDLKIESAEAQPLPDGSVRVALAYVGVCHSDIARLATGAGPFPFRMGHEASGTVVESRSAKVLPGSRVTAYVNDAYATEVVTDAKNVVQIADACDLADGALAEPLACVIGGIEMLDLHEARSVAVVGAGFMGLLAIRLLAAAGHEVVVVEPRAKTRKLAEDLGAVQTLTPDRVTSADSGRFDVVVEAVGAAAGLATASELVATGGTLGILGYHQSEGGKRQVPMEQWNFKGIRVSNLHHRNRDDVLRWITKAQRMSSLKIVTPSSLVDSTVGLDDLAGALVGHRDVVKTLVRI